MLGLYSDATFYLHPSLFLQFLESFAALQHTDLLLISEGMSPGCFGTMHAVIHEHMTKVATVFSTYRRFPPIAVIENELEFVTK